MTTIDYDRPVLDLIAGLSATGHVTHRSFDKKTVTFHHNAGRMSHYGVLRVWQKRPASAHFNVDARGTVAQYVKADEYAWHSGHTQTNRESIGIEMCNATLAPNWEVSPTTWRSACRLAGWLFAFVIKEKPSRDNIVFHRDVRATSCPGPYMAKRRGSVVKAVTEYYEEFINPQPAAAPSWPTSTTVGRVGDPVRQIQRLLEVSVDGKWGPGTDKAARLMRAAAYAHSGYPTRKSDFDIEAVQKIIDTSVDGIWGPKSQAALVSWIKQLQRVIATSDDGVWGPKTDNKFLLSRGRYFMKY